MPSARLKTCPHDVRIGGARFFLCALLLVLQATDLSAAPTAISRQVILIGENTRMSFDEEIVRIAVGDPQIANVQMVSNREILVLGRRAGQTNLLFWYATGRVAERGLRVERDLSLLTVALESIHPEIEALSAPDQDAVVLRGVVPDVRFSRAAEAIAIDYLRGGALGRAREGALILGADAPSEVASEEPLSTESSELGRNFLLEDATGGGGGRVINLIRVDDVPPALEERIRLAVSNSDGVQISIRRLTAGALPDDSRDTFVLEGRVRTQVALVRALLSAARMVDDRANAGQIEVVADEGGALSGRSSGGTGGGGASLGGAGTTIGGTGGCHRQQP
jgi:hypothetical protein